MHKKLASLMAILVVPTLLVTGCKKKETEEKADTKAVAEAPKTDEQKAPPMTDVQPPKGEGPVATVNGTEIPREAFNTIYTRTMSRYARAKQQMPPGLKRQLIRNIVNRLVDDEVIRQQAEKRGIKIEDKELDERMASHRRRFGSEEKFQRFLTETKTTEEDMRNEHRMNLLREKIFESLSKDLKVTDKEVEAYYKENPERYTQGEQVKASHILVKVERNATLEQKKQAKEKITKILEDLKKPGADFAELAKQYSDCPSKNRGGDLGFFTRGKMVKPFEEVAFKLKEGELSDIVETPFGYHIIKVTGHKEPSKRSLAEVKDSIRRILESRGRNENIRKAMKEWKSAAKIELLETGASVMPTPPPATTPKTKQASQEEKKAEQK